MTPTALLLEELEETLLAVGEVGLYEFATRAQAFASSADEIDDLCRRAYVTLTERFAMHLEWYRWPPQSIGRAEADAPIDFSFDHEADVDTPYLVLVPDDPGSVSAELERQFYPNGRGR